MVQRGAYILSTGTELSTGNSQDTNAPYLARALREEGFRIIGMRIIPDDPLLLEKGLRSLLEEPEIDLLLLSGGLGPTADDHSIDVLAELFSQEIIKEKEALQKLEKFYKKYPKALSLESAYRQVRVLKGALVMKNEVGLAPGLILEWKGKNKDCLLAAFPGVPREMKAMFERKFLRIWQEKFSHSARAIQDIVQKKIFYLYGLGESSFQDSFSKILSKYKKGEVSWGLSAKLGHLKVFCEAKQSKSLQEIEASVKEVFREHFLEGEAGELLHKFCIQKKIKIGTAESCTGGLIAKLITDRSGSSSYFEGSIISYSNEVKESHLRLSKQLLEEKGAVSKECVLGMAEALLQNLKLDFALAVSGIAGPTGGTKEKPVGTVYLAFASREGGRKTAYRLFFPLDREGIRQYSARMALFHFYKFMKKGAENP